MMRAGGVRGKRRRVLSSDGQFHKTWPLQHLSTVHHLRHLGPDRWNLTNCKLRCTLNNYDFACLQAQPRPRPRTLPLPLRRLHRLPPIRHPGDAAGPDPCPKALQCRRGLPRLRQRWLKASKRHGIKKLGRSHDDALLKTERIPDIVGIHELMNQTDYDPETWHVQIFRSIDSNSVKGFPKDPREATKKNLVCGKNVLIDMSIHTAYVNAIRAAQHFIYIENQYFLGSSFNWDSNKDIGANNLIPIEIALKIANKIKPNERFSAYIVIPMWPEGNPTGAATQRILYWQFFIRCRFFGSEFYRIN